MNENSDHDPPRKGPGKTLLMIWGTVGGFVLLIILIGWVIVATR